MSVISKDTGMDNSLVEIRSWLIKQLQGFLDAMLGVVNTSSEEIQGLIVRTILEVTNFFSFISYVVTHSILVCQTRLENSLFIFIRRYTHDQC